MTGKGMPTTLGIWTRRQFVRGAAGMVALPYLKAEEPPAAKPGRHYAYIAGNAGSVDAGSIGAGSIDSGSISVFAPPMHEIARIEKAAAWPLLQRVASHAPASLLFSPTHPVLYVANDVEICDGVRRGSVEFFHVDPATGSLAFGGRIPLSLSATRPRQLALSPDGKLLAVGAYGGGIYNLLPVGEHGSLGAPCGIFKDVGCGQNAALQASAHPHSLIFDADGKRLLSTDFGADRLNLFAIDEGRMTRLTQHTAGPGSGPGNSVLHPAGFLYVSHDLTDRLVRYRYEESTGAFTGPAPVAGSSGSFALHPAAHTLYGTQSQGRILRVWQVNARDGMLGSTQTLNLKDAMPRHVHVTPDGRYVYVLAGGSGSVLRFQANPQTGELSPHAGRFNMHSPRCIATRMV